MKFTPLHDRLLVKPAEDSAEKHGSLYIPDVAKDKPQEGKVVAAGTGYYNRDGKFVSLTVKTGDMILYGKYAGSEIKIDGEEFIILKEEEVFGIMHKDLRKSGAA